MTREGKDVLLLVLQTMCDQPPGEEERKEWSKAQMAILEVLPEPERGKVAKVLVALITLVQALPEEIRITTLPLLIKALLED